MTYANESRERRATIAEALDQPDVEAFTVTPRAKDGSSDYDAAFDILAETVEQAAERAAHKLHGNDVTSHRTTGDPGKSGYFQAYRWLAKVNAWSSVGRPFHVG